MLDPISRPIDNNDIKYTVQKGDTIKKIAELYLQSEEMWDFLYLFNCRNDVTLITGGKPLSPNLIFIGQILLIPNASGPFVKPKTYADKLKDFTEQKLGKDSDFAKFILNKLKEGITYKLADAPGVSFASESFQMLVKFDGGKLNLKLADDKDFSSTFTSTTSAKIFLDDIGEDSHKVFSELMSTPKMEPFKVNWKEVIKLANPNNWGNISSTKFIEPIKVKYSAGPISGEWNTESKKLDLEKQNFRVFTAKEESKDADSFGSIEFTFDTPPLFLASGKVMFKGKAAGNLGKQIQGFEMSWKDYSAEMDVIFQFQGSDTIPNPQHPVPAPLFFPQKTLAEYVSTNYGAASSSYTEPGAKFGSQMTESIVAGAISPTAALGLGAGMVAGVGAGIALGAGLVAALAVEVAVDYIFSAELITAARMLMLNGTRAVGILGLGGGAAGAFGEPMVPTSDRHVMQKQLTGPALRHSQGKKGIPIEFMLTSTGKMGAVQSRYSNKKETIQFKAKK